MKNDLIDRRRRAKLTGGHVKIEFGDLDPVLFARDKAEAVEIKRLVSAIHAAKNEAQRKAAEKGLNSILVGLHWADVGKV